LLLLRRWRSVYDGLARASSDRAFLAALLRGFLSPPAYTLSGAGVCLVVGRAVALLWRGPRVVPVPRLLFILAASIRLRLRGCGRATLRVFGGGPKVNMSRREAASMYANFLCASSCSYSFLSPAPQRSSCGVLSSSFPSAPQQLTLVWSVLLVFPAQVETVQCNVLRDGDSQSCMAATGAVAVPQRSTTLRL